MFRDGITGVSQLTPINPDLPCFVFLEQKTRVHQHFFVNQLPLVSHYC